MLFTFKFSNLIKYEILKQVENEITLLCNIY